MSHVDALGTCARGNPQLCSKFNRVLGGLHSWCCVCVATAARPRASTLCARCCTRAPTRHPAQPTRRSILPHGPRMLVALPPVSSEPPQPPPMSVQCWCAAASFARQRQQLRTGIAALHWPLRVPLNHRPATLSPCSATRFHTPASQSATCRSRVRMMPNEAAYATCVFVSVCCSPSRQSTHVRFAEGLRSRGWPRA